jgi:AcrR family transcriptional regulator
MERVPTKERILLEALSLFAEKGYEAVSVAEIADAVGIKAPSLYKHYTSKQDIFDAIIEKMGVLYEQMAASMQMNGSSADKDAGLFMSVSEETLIAMGKKLFLYFLHDEYASKFRKMLTIEQYHNTMLASLYKKQYMDDPLAYQGLAFGMFVQAGFMIDEDPSVMALHFYAPLFLLLNLCDCHPEAEAEAMNTIERHIRQFNRLYKKVE